MKNKKKRNKTTLIGMLSVGFVALCVILGIFIYVGFDETIVGFDRDKILKQAVANVNKYDNYLFSMVVYRVREGEELHAEYMIGGDRNSSYRSYSYMDDFGEDDEFWYYDEEAGEYCIYIYSTEVGSWVKCYYEAEPVSTDPYSVLAYMDDYTLLEDYYEFGGVNCYAFQMAGTSDEFPLVYDRIYVTVDNPVLVGAIRVGVSEDAYTSVDDAEVDQNILDSVGQVADINDYTATAELNDQVIIRFEYLFADESLMWYEEPEVFITEDEYLYLMELEGKDG